MNGHKASGGKANVSIFTAGRSIPVLAPTSCPSRRARAWCCRCRRHLNRRDTFRTSGGAAWKTTYSGRDPRRRVSVACEASWLRQPLSKLHTFLSLSARCHDSSRRVRNESCTVRARFPKRLSSSWENCLEGSFRGRPCPHRHRLPQRSPVSGGWWLTAHAGEGM